MYDRSRPRVLGLPVASPEAWPMPCESPADRDDNAHTRHHCLAPRGRACEDWNRRCSARSLATKPSDLSRLETELICSMRAEAFPARGRRRPMPTRKEKPQMLNFRDEVVPKSSDGNPPAIEECSKLACMTRPRSTSAACGRGSLPARASLIGRNREGRIGNYSEREPCRAP